MSVAESRLYKSPLLQCSCAFCLQLSMCGKQQQICVAADAEGGRTLRHTLLDVLAEFVHVLAAGLSQNHVIAVIKHLHQEHGMYMSAKCAPVTVQSNSLNSCCDPASRRADAASTQSSLTMSEPFDCLTSGSICSKEATKEVHLHLLEVEDLIAAGLAADLERVVGQTSQRSSAARVLRGLLAHRRAQTRQVIVACVPQPVVQPAQEI